MQKPNLTTILFLTTLALTNGCANKALVKQIPSDPVAEFVKDVCFGFEVKVWVENGNVWSYFSSKGERRFCYIQDDLSKRSWGFNDLKNPQLAAWFKSQLKNIRR